MSPSEVDIRAARAQDLPAMVGLLRLLFSLEKDFCIDQERQRRGLLMLLASPGARLLAAQAEGRVVGMVSGQLVVSTSEGALSLWAEDLVVEPAWRGQGVGRGLMTSLAAWARERGATRLQLLADRENQAGVQFHQQLGYGITRMICLRQSAI